MSENRLLFHRRSNSLRAHLNLFPIAVWRHNQEFFSAVTSNQIIGSDSLLHTPGSLNEDLISGQMPIGIVYLLEMVEVEHDDADSATGARCEFILTM